MLSNRNSAKILQSVRTAPKSVASAGSIGTAESVVPSTHHVVTTSQKSVKSETIMETVDLSDSNTETMDTQNDETCTENILPKRVIWRDIYAEVEPEKKLFGRWGKNNDEPLRVVLNGVSGYANPGQITFLMGSSGAGKTTLLNILTQQSKGLNIYGEVAVNKRIVEPGEMRRMSAYVEQEDLFIGELTVRETLMLNAYLRMPARSTPAERFNRLDHVSTEMGLEPCLNTKIGSKHEKSISKGEKKRLAFACELLTDPHILFCDEPTSGLDSFMALQVIRALKTLAGEGKTIICSIHQPSSQVYELADRLVLMGSGRVAYQGPAGYIGEYFASIEYPCPRFISVTDHFLNVLSHNPEKEEDHQYKKRMEAILEKYSESELTKETLKITHEESTSTTSSRRKIKDVDEKPEYAAPWCTQFYWLLWRGLMCVLRNPMILRLRMFQTFIIAVMMGVIYFQLELSSETMLNYRGLAFCSSRDMVMFFLYPCIDVFTSEIHIAKREYRSAMYRPSAYFMGRNIADSVQYLIFPLVYSTIVYWMAIPFANNFQQFAVFWAVTTLMSVTAASIGYAGACIFGDLAIAASYMPLFTVPMFVFGGFFIDLKSISPYFQWVSYLSWYRYAFQTNIINFFSGVDYIKGCERSIATYDNSTNISTTSCPFTTFNRTLLNNATSHGQFNSCMGSNGAEVLEAHDVEYATIWSGMLAMVAMTLAWRSVAMIALHFRLKRG